ncbi:MAG: ribose 5-phosphate isomerase B [Deltaproteobacteria bacterium]|nr:ribose 5-phosphate isomerase B [Deltaproteobacteria bacterium]
MTTGKIIIGSDHAGYSLKQNIIYYLQDMGMTVADAGATSGDSVDYPDYGSLVAQSVSSGEFERGILICGSGIGMSIVANKFPNVRAALCLDEDMAEMSRLHNNSNILVLAGRKTDTATAKAITATWLKTEFEGGRHTKRIDKIKDLEHRLSKTPNKA